MYPSSNIKNPFESLFKRSFPFDQKPSPKQDDPSLFFHFPSPFLDENEFPLNQILFQNHPMTVHNCIAHDYQIETYLDGTKRETTEGCNIDPSKLNEKSTESIPNEAITLVKKNLGSLLLKRTGKKDRHSKICTARGVRDRRMRLSLQVARKFFDLQDLLGYDKASKTIEWLFTKSKTAIKELSKNNPKVKTNSILDDLNSESFVSECDMVSVIEENSVNAHKGAAIKYASTERKKNDKKPQKSVYKPNSRESRDKARARARDRTRKKMIIKGLENSNKWWFDSNPNDFQQLEPFSSSLEAVEESSSHNQKHDAYTNSLESQLFDVGIIEKFLGNSSTDSWAIHDYSNNNFLGFLGNWDVNNDRINSEMTNMVSFAGNPSSVNFPTSCFPFQQ